MKLQYNIDKFGTAGMLLIAIFSPCCFPLFAFVLSALGLGSFELLGGWTMWIFQTMVLISLVGFYFGLRKHHNFFPFWLALASALSIFYGYNFSSSAQWHIFLYSGMFGLLIATGINYYLNKTAGTCDTCKIIDGKTVELQSEITCPNCGHKKKEIMPIDACQFFYECENCKTVLKPKQGDYCVYCSYGTVKCPSIQTGKNCC